MKEKKQNPFIKSLKSFFSNIANGFKFGKKKNVDVLQEESIATPWQTVFKKFFKTPLGVIGLVSFIAIFAVVFIGSAVTNFNPYYTEGVLKNIPPSSGYTDIPKKLVDEGIKDIQSGIVFSVGISNAGHIYQWGGKLDVMQGLPDDLKKKIESEGIDQIAVSDRHALALTKKGNIYGWGQNNHRQTELPFNIKQAIRGEKIKKIGANENYSILLTESGFLYAWGAVLPTRLDRISSKLQGEIEDFRTGNVNVLVKLKDNKIDVVGVTGSELSTKIPNELKEGKYTILDMARMQNSGAVLTKEKGIITWGTQLEDADKIPKMEGNPIKLAGGRYNFLALTDKGRVYSWGKPDNGVLNAPTKSGYTDIYSAFYTNYAVDGKTKTVDSWGLKGFLIGSDENGRDLFTRLLHGGRATLLIAFIAVIIQVLIGVIVGLISGFYGGTVDNLLMRFSEIIASFPFYPTIITLSATIPPDWDQYKRIIMVMILLGILGWTGIARLIRGQILSEREKDYIVASRALGQKEWKVIMSHIFPNIVSIVIVQATLGYAGNLLSEAGLSFLGFGVKEPYPSWGNILNSAQSIDVIEIFWWRWLIPGLAVFSTALSVNLIGDALRDALDPKSLDR